MTLENAGKNNWGKGNIWIYTDSSGKRHKLENAGYYFGWQCDMWKSSWNAVDCHFWTEEYCKKHYLDFNAKYSWSVGTIAPSRRQLIKRIEKDLEAVE